MTSSGIEATVALIAVLCVTAGTASAAVAQECPLAKSVEITESLVLYNEAPEPWWFFPLVLSTVEQVGLVDTGQQLTICETVRRSTWRQRSLWVRVIAETSKSEANRNNSGTRRPPAHGWVNAGPVDLNSFLTRQGAR